MTRARTTTRAGVGRAAAGLARRGGIDAVSVRAVAATLGVTPMALYHYVASAADLRLVTLDAILAQVRTTAGDAPAPTAPTARTALRDFAVHARSVLRRYPGAADAVLVSWPELVQGCRIMEWLLATAATVTRARDRRVDIANGVFVYVLMRVMTERRALDAGRRRELTVVQEHPERFPQLVASQARFAVIDTERHFAVGLDALLAGLIDR